MVTYVLDSSAVLRFLDKEAGRERISLNFIARSLQQARIVISAVQWGGIASVLCKRNQLAHIPRTVERLTDIGVEVVVPSPDQAVQAGILQCTLRLPYADAFVVALAQHLDRSDHRDGVLRSAFGQPSCAC